MEAVKARTSGRIFNLEFWMQYDHGIYFDQSIIRLDTMCITLSFVF
jgi:hypothetical protein